MDKTLEELKQVLAGVRKAVNSGVEQDKEVVRSAEVLINKIKALPNAVNFESEIRTLWEATKKLSSDNAATQEALNKAERP